MTRRTTIVAFAAAFAAACSRDLPPLPAVDVAVHRDSVELWHAARQKAVYGPTGWAAMLGLWWVDPGEIAIGADSSNRIVLPKDRAPRRLGSIHIDKDSAWFVAAAGTRVTVDTNRTPVASARMHSDLETSGNVVRAGTLMIYYLVREDRGVFKHAVRIRDTASVLRAPAVPLKYFPTDIKWRVQAHYQPTTAPDSLNIISVLGTETRMVHPGDIHFTIDGHMYALKVIREPEDHAKDLFVMFTDSTNRKESYPATRYVWVPYPDSLGRTVIDFNKSYNPPCAFTKFATCPFPPKGNHVPLYVTAGEWNPHYVEHLQP
jgi:uncharacterized protein (DUF1684 family)